MGLKFITNKSSQIKFLSSGSRESRRLCWQMAGVGKQQRAQVTRRERRLQSTSVKQVDESAIWHHLQQDNHFPWIWASSLI